MRYDGRPPAGSPERAAFLEALRRRIARGEYHIPAEAVADAVLAAWAGRGPSEGRAAGGDHGRERPAR